MRHVWKGDGGYMYMYVVVQKWRTEEDGGGTEGGEEGES